MGVSGGAPGARFRAGFQHRFVLAPENTRAPGGGGPARFGAPPPCTEISSAGVAQPGRAPPREPPAAPGVQTTPAPAVARGWPRAPGSVPVSWCLSPCPGLCPQTLGSVPVSDFARPRVLLRVPKTPVLVPKALCASLCLSPSPSPCPQTPLHVPKSLSVSPNPSPCPQTPVPIPMPRCPQDHPGGDPNTPVELTKGMGTPCPQYPLKERDPKTLKQGDPKSPDDGVASRRWCPQHNVPNLVTPSG